MQVGDEVNYLPHECHAFDKDATNGERAWVFGRKHNKQVKQHGKQPSFVEEVHELSDREAEDMIAFIGRCPDPAVARKELALVRPKAPWKAVVKAVNPDDTVNLAVRSCVGGVTIHYDNVPVKDVHAPHTCHAPKIATEELPRE